MVPRCPDKRGSTELAVSNHSDRGVYFCTLYSSTEHIGRPRESFDLDNVEFLISLKLCIVKVANILGISRTTLYRRLKEHDRYISKYATITDNDLDNLVRRIKQGHPCDGEVMMAGHLHSLGVWVPRFCLRASIH